MTSIDIGQLRQWLGRSETREDLIAAAPAVALAATLDRDDGPPRPGDDLPPLWHWLYFLPPVPLPRRMWAGGRVWFHRPLRIGAAATRLSRIVDVSRKSGRSGELVF